MKSDVIHITSGGEGIAEALRQTEAVAVFKMLPKKDAIHLLLLTEEMTGMMKALTGEHEADFWIEDENGTFCLHLKSETVMNAELRNRLLAVSTSGENIAAKGVMGKIKDLFNRILEPTEAAIPREYICGWNNMLTNGDAAVYARNMSIVASNVWSLNQYKSVSKDSEEAWDELEQSIVANIADEVEIGIADNTVEMVIYKTV